MSVNVLKQIRTRGGRRRRGGVVVTSSRIGGGSCKTKTYKFKNRGNTFDQFIDVPVEELSELIEAFIETQSSNEDMLSVLSKIKTSIPYSLLNEFFRSIPSDQGPLALIPAFDRFVIRPDIVERISSLRRLLEMRRNIPLPNDRRIRRRRIEPTTTSRSTVRLKYNISDLNRFNRTDLERLASNEGVVGTKHLSVRELRSILGNIREPVSRLAAERKYGERELPLTCISIMKNAPWVGYPDIIGMVVKPKVYADYGRFATALKADRDWFRVTASWYPFACSGKRRFEDGAVGYRRSTDDIVITETRAMFDAADDFVRTGKLLIKERQPELAPGLFVALQELIDGKSYYCDSCNISIDMPIMKSIDRNKRVMFCSEACLDSYKFSK